MDTAGKEEKDVGVAGVNEENGEETGKMENRVCALGKYMYMT